MPAYYLIATPNAERCRRGHTGGRKLEVGDGLKCGVKLVFLSDRASCSVLPHGSGANHNGSECTFFDGIQLLCRGILPWYGLSL